MGMTDKKIRQLLDGYEAKLSKMKNGHGSWTPSWGQGARYPDADKKLEHTAGMIPKMRKFLDEGRREKAFRWLGFLQCVFWMLDVYTVDELAGHSRPSKPEIKEQHPWHPFTTPEHPCRCSLCREYTEAPDFLPDIQ